jgi:hypothetical protein
MSRQVFSEMPRSGMSRYSPASITGSSFLLCRGLAGHAPAPPQVLPQEKQCVCPSEYSVAASEEPHFAQGMWERKGTLGWVLNSGLFSWRVRKAPDFGRCRCVARPARKCQIRTSQFGVDLFSYPCPPARATHGLGATDSGVAAELGERATIA